MDINFESGVKEYTVNGTTTIRFNPTDSDFVKRLFDAFDEIDKESDEWKNTVTKTGDRNKIFELTAKADKETRAAINGVFGYDVCTDVFGNMNVYALGDGLPVWVNFCIAIMEECDTAFARERKATDPRINKYLKKYSK